MRLQRPWLLGAALFGGMCLSAPPARANFVFFNLPGAHPGQSARVAEQIVCANILCTGLDYQFYVLNTGVVGIDGVAFGLGIVGNGAGQIGAGGRENGGTLSIATRPGGGDGVFPAIPFANVGLWGGTQVLGIPGGFLPYSAGPLAWGFEEFQDPGTGGALPATFYAVRWYSPVQGPFAAKLFPGRWVRLDLFTVFGPAGGTGAVDPPDISLPFFAFDTVNGDLNIDPLSSLTTDWTHPCDPATESCTPLTDPLGDSAFASATQQLDSQFTPEPATFAMIGGALALLGYRKIRRAKKA